MDMHCTRKRFYLQFMTALLSCVFFYAAHSAVQVTDLYEVAQGSVVLTTSSAISNQYVYSPYGTEKNLDQPKILHSAAYSNLSNQTRKPLNITRNQFGYTGQTQDQSTGLMMLGKFRNYAPGIGRFIQPDTYNSFSKHHINNPTAYVNGDPMLFADPTGHMIFGTLFGMGEANTTDIVGTWIDAVNAFQSIIDFFAPEEEITEEAAEGLLSKGATIPDAPSNTPIETNIATEKTVRTLEDDQQSLPSSIDFAEDDRGTPFDMDGGLPSGETRSPETNSSPVNDEYKELSPVQVVDESLYERTVRLQADQEVSDIFFNRALRNSRIDILQLRDDVTDLVRKDQESFVNTLKEWQDYYPENLHPYRKAIDFLKKVYDPNFEKLSADAYWHPSDAVANKSRDLLDEFHHTVLPEADYEFYAYMFPDKVTSSDEEGEFSESEY